MIFDLFANFPLGEGFGINGNVLETNVVNLAVVIGVLVKYGGEIATTTLKERKEKILKSITDAEERYAEAQRQLALAKDEIEVAKKKAENIRSQSLVTAEQTVQKIFKSAEEEINRLEESKQATLQLEEKKALAEVCDRVSRLVLDQATKTIKQRVDPTLRSRLVDLNIAILGTSKSLNF